MRPKNRRSRISILATLALLLPLAACSETRPFTRGETLAPRSLDAKEVVQRVLLLGDAGGSATTGPVLKLAQSRILPGRTTAIFLGDNIYPSGLPSPTNIKGQSILKAQLDPMKEANTIMVAGNHDWDSWDKEGFQRIKYQADFVNGYSKSTAFLPNPNDKSFPDPAVTLRPGLRIVSLDTQWWLHAYEKPRDSAETKMAYLKAITNQIKNTKDNLPIIVAGHHPIESYGPHGSHFGKGDATSLLRAMALTRQDLAHPEYRKLADGLREAMSAKTNSLVIYVSGHEHSLQVMQEKTGPDYLIVSGAVSKSTGVGHGDSSLFSYQHTGYVELDVSRNGEVLMRVLTLENGVGKTVHSRWLQKRERGDPRIQSPRVDRNFPVEQLLTLKEAKKLSPIIDIHFSVFNKYDIPLEGYLRNQGHNHGAAHFIAILLNAKSKELQKAIGQSSITEQDAQILIESLNEDQSMSLNTNGKKGLLSDPAFVNSVRKHLLWLKLLSSRNVDIGRSYLKTNKHVDFFVPSMTDMRQWHETYKPVRAYEGKDGQVALAEKLISAKKLKGQSHPVIAFNPEIEWLFRNGKHPTSSLALVLDAVKNRGFLGITFNPSHGYRPIDNSELFAEGGPINCIAYGIRTLDNTERQITRGHEYDEIMRDLFLKCVEHNIPVFAASQQHDAAAGKKSKECWKHGHPKYWKKLLSCPGKEGEADFPFTQLRLNLMHFGGSNGLAQDDGTASWAWQIAELMLAHPNVYADVGNSAISESSYIRERFFRNYRSMVMKFQRRGLDLQKRIMFGTDWLTIHRSQIHYKDYVTRHLGAFKHHFGTLATRDFASRNALRFLGLVPNDKGSAPGFQRISDYYSKNKIKSEAKWWTFVRKANGK
jgi:predicted TIM-barrel fold metal-dependent hydrolase